MRILCGVFPKIFGREQKSMKRNYYFKHLPKWLYKRWVRVKERNLFMPYPKDGNNLPWEELNSLR